MVAALIVGSLSRSSTSRSSRPCRSTAGSKMGISGLRRFEQRRSDASHNAISASEHLRHSTLDIFVWSPGTKIHYIVMLGLFIGG